MIRTCQTNKRNPTARCGKSRTPGVLVDGIIVIAARHDAQNRAWPPRDSPQHADESTEDAGGLTDTVQPAAADLLGSRRQLLDSSARRNWRENSVILNVVGRLSCQRSFVVGHEQQLLYEKRTVATLGHVELVVRPVLSFPTGGRDSRGLMSVRPITCRTMHDNQTVDDVRERALADYDRDHFGAAAELLDFVLRLRPDDGYGWLAFGESLRHLGRWEEAERALQTALAQASPDFSPSLKHESRFCCGTEGGMISHGSGLTERPSRTTWRLGVGSGSCAGHLFPPRRI